MAANEKTEVPMNVGDKVKFCKGGVAYGDTMTVTGHAEDGRNVCEWDDGLNQHHGIWYADSELTLVTE
jgi:uncharacterized protein YodC (DUF2158 family)